MEEVKEIRRRSTVCGSVSRALGFDTLWYDRNNCQVMPKHFIPYLMGGKEVYLWSKQVPTCLSLRGTGNREIPACWTF